jgi:methyltransferase
MLIPLGAALVVLLTMLGELVVSRAHERALFARGAVAPADPVYPVMRWAYPLVFVAMVIEGLLSGPAPSNVVIAGILVFVLGKALKFWAIHALGEFWTYRVLVVPGAPLVADGPYRLMRHPNYVGVLGELIGMALVVGARFTGPLATLFFSYLLWRRIRAEEAALRGIIATHLEP